MGNSKIENKKVKEELAVPLISAKTIEALLRFLSIEPDDPKYMLDRKMNAVRIEI